MKPINLMVDEELHHRFKVWCTQHNKSMREVISVLMEKHLKRSKE